jgi:alkylation response protein AidB-like acyl-CoA dehydrogenase
MIMESAHHQLLRDSTRRFVERHMPREAARRWDRENIFPRDVYDALAEMGVMGLTVPEEFGGQGVDLIGTMIVIEELAKRSSAVACPYIMTACYAGMNLVEQGSQAQKRELLPRVAAGKLLFAYGLSEPNVGGDLAMVETVARREGNRILLSGTKRWCTGAHVADYVFCLARTGPKEDRYRNLTIFLVPPRQGGGRGRHLSREWTLAMGIRVTQRPDDHGRLRDHARWPARPHALWHSRFAHDDGAGRRGAVP